MINCEANASFLLDSATAQRKPHKVMNGRRNDNMRYRARGSTMEH